MNMWDQTFCILSIVGLLAIMLFAVIKTASFIIADVRRERAFQKKNKEVEKMKAEGGHHEWVQIPMGTKEYYVCQKTGWCPALEGFVDMGYIKIWRKKRSEEKDYKEYRDQRVKSIAESYGLSVENMEKIVEAVFDIKKQWVIKRIERLTKEAGEKNGTQAN